MKFLEHIMRKEGLENLTHTGFIGDKRGSLKVLSVVIKLKQFYFEAVQIYKLFLDPGKHCLEVIFESCCQVYIDGCVELSTKPGVNSFYTLPICIQMCMQC